MDVRCGSCNRIFRIADSKITGSGIKFKCTQCGAYVNITLEDYQAYKLSSETASVLASDVPQVKEQQAVAATPVVSPASAPSPVCDATSAETIHPFVSGSLAGAYGGIGCAIPVLALTLLGISSLSLLAGGKTGNLPVGQAMLLAGSSLIGFGVLIGIVLASFQARTENKIFGYPGVLIGSLLGAIFGAVKGMIVGAGSGTVFSAAIIAMSALGWGIKALFLSLVVVLARHTIVSSRTESTAATISGGQLLVIGLASLAAFLGIFGEVRMAMNLNTVKEEASKVFQDMSSAEGLQVTNSLSSWDSATGDLVLNVTIENRGDAEKRQWYLVAKVNDASGNVLSTVKMLTGKQLFTQRDYEIMGRRGVNVQNLQMEHMKQKLTPLAAHGTMDVEMRVMEPPADVASFEASFLPFDLLKILREQLEEVKKQKGGAASQ